MPQISVIVPVYKVEPYLHRCIDSILAQTFTDFEIILVDDGSPDGCSSICDEYLLLDERIKVIHKINGGLSDARNYGIDYSFACSDSQWLSFIDSDDWVHIEFIRLLFNAIKKQNIPIVVCRYKSVLVNKPNVLSVSNEYIDVTPDQWFLFDENFYSINSAWAKMYSKTLWINIRFPIGRINEDRFTIYRVLFACERLRVVEENLYFYYLSQNSIMRSSWSPRRMDDLLACEEQLAYFLKNDYKSAYRITVQKYRKLIEWNISNVIASDEYKNEYQKQLRHKLRKSLNMEQEISNIGLWKTTHLYENAYPILCIIIMSIKKIRELGSNFLINVEKKRHKEFGKTLY